MATSSNSRGLVILLLTSGFFITGLLFDYMPFIVDNQIKRTVELATNEEIKSLWSKPPVDFHSYYWLYDILNAEQFLAGEKVRLRKVGPYHFSSKIEKRIIELSQNKLRLIYNSTRYFHLNESEAPEGQLDEPLRLLNPIYVSLMEATREQTGKMDPEQRALLIGSANRLAEKTNETLIIAGTPRTALLGRKVALLQKARRMIETFGLDAKLPLTPPDDIFGYVAVANGTWTGPLEIYTGYQVSMPALGNVISYKGKRRLSEYLGRCGRIQTSAGELRPMPLEAGQQLEMFSPNFCRIVHLVPTGTRKFREGIGFTYSISPDDFLSADANPDNRCFCVNGTRDNYCSLNGVLELAPCTYYSPVVLSLGGIEPDERIKDSIADWDPDLISSETELAPPPDSGAQLVLLKRIGVPLRADITITLFMKVMRDPSFRHAGSLPNVSYIPVMTVREIGGIPPRLSGVVISLESFLALSHHVKVIMYLSALVLLCCLTGHYSSRSARERAVPSEPSAALTGAGSGGRDSDRANSADSSRSQPPSGNGSSASGDSSRQKPQAGNSEERRSVVAAVSAYAGGYSAQAGARDRQGQQQSDGAQKAESQKQYQRRQPGLARRSSRVFSKVDELLAQQSSKADGRDVSSVATSNGALANSPAKSAGAGGKATSGQTGDGQSEEDAAADTPNKLGEGRRARGNWFLKVCSSFVQMLSNLRATINDAGQLDIRENDCQDKQLEMLAGKIDNWYSGNEADSETDAAGASSPTAAPTADSPGANGYKRPSGQELHAKLGAESGESSSPPAAPSAGLARQRREAQLRGSSSAESEPSSPATKTQPVEQSPARPPPTTTEPVAAKTNSSKAAATTSSETLENSTSQIQPALGGGNGDSSLSSQDLLASKASSERKDSGQSSQTIINKSDTSGDESRVSSAGVDKAKALEQLESTLGGGGDTASAAAASPAEGEPRGVEVGAKKPTMINSSTSIDFTFDQMAAEADSLASNGFADAATATGQEKSAPVNTPQAQ